MAAVEQTPTSGTTILPATKGAYLVLRASDASDARGGWLKVTTVKAASADGAIRIAAKDTPGTYVAIPARSWNPRTLSVEQITRARLT